MKAAFDHIVHEHGATVLRMTRSMLPRADADDAWSETFLAALRAYPGLPADANVEAWLVTIARRKSIDIVRAADRHAIPVAELPDQLSEIGIPDGHDLDLARLIATLPEKQRRAVTLHYLAGMPHQHVATWSAAPSAIFSSPRQTWVSSASRTRYRTTTESSTRLRGTSVLECFAQRNGSTRRRASSTTTSAVWLRRRARGQSHPSRTGDGSIMTTSATHGKSSGPPEVAQRDPANRESTPSPSGPRAEYPPSTISSVPVTNEELVPLR
jgi:RNA polymerase sigma factor (sigma-70 family)